MPLPRPAPGTLKWWVIGAIGVVAMSALAIVWGLSATVGKAHWSTERQKVHDATSVTVYWTITKPTDKSTTCTLHALAENFGTVGQLDVVVPAGGPETRQMETTIRTTSQSVTGKVKYCSVPQ